MNEEIKVMGGGGRAVPVNEEHGLINYINTKSQMSSFKKIDL